MSHWLSIEIFNGPYAAQLWADSHGDSLIEAAVSNNATDWEVKPTAWGVVFELAFPSDAACDKFRSTEAVIVALKTVPDPITGVLIYRGKSTDSGNGSKRNKPKPFIGSGSAALPLPIDTMPFLEPLPAFFSGSGADRRRLTSAN